MINAAHRPLTLALLASLLAACQVTPGTSAVKVAARKSTASSSAAPARLLQGATGTIKLVGTLALDARYAVGKGGNLLAAANGSVAAPEGGKLAGSGVISNDGGTIIAQGGGNVIVDKAPVISNDGGTIIGQDGNNIVAQGGGNYHLEAVQDIPYGTLMPAVGMVVQVRTLHDNQRVALGIDGQGKPAYAVFTNLEGKFQLFLPPNLAQNVCIFATPRTSTDRKLRYNVIGMAHQTAKIDEDTSQATGYIIGSITGRVKQLMATDPATVSTLAPVFGALDAQLATVAQQAGVSKLSDARREALAEQVTDTLMSSIDLTQATFDDGNGQTPKCLDTITGIMAVTRENMGKRMADLASQGQNPTTYLDAQDFMKPGLAIGMKLEKPSDFLDLLVRTQLQNVAVSEIDRASNIHGIVIAAGLPTDDQRMVSLWQASTGLLAYCGKVLTGAPAATNDAMQLIRTATK